MDFCTVLFIAVFQIIICAMADWDPLSPLILVDQLPFTSKAFPYVVERPDPNKCTIYDNYNAEKTATTFLYCPKSSGGVQNQKFNYAESFTYADYENNQCPRQKCELEVQYDKMRVKDDEPQYCQHNDNVGYRYEFVYLLCKDNASAVERIKIYEICYQDDLNQIINGHFTIPKPNLLRNDILHDEQAFPFQFSAQPNHNNFLDRLNELYQQMPNYEPRSVLPPEFLPYGHQRKAFFNHMNAAPMHFHMKSSWEGLMKILKTTLAQMDHAIHVTAGLFHVPTDHDDSKYLGKIDGNWMIQIANVWWVQIYNHDYSKGIAILMHKQTFQANTYFDEEYCDLSICEIANITAASSILFINRFILISCCHPGYINNKFNLNYSPQKTSNILRFPNQ